MREYGGQGQENEARLIRRAMAGDTEAFAILVAEQQRFVYNLALRTLGNPQEAEDVAQETFVKAWLALPRFREQAKFQTWLYRIVTNLCYNRLPRLRRELAALSEEAMVNVPDEALTDPAANVATREQVAFLLAQVERLPELYRMLIALRYQQELSYAEIAEVLEIPLGTVKTGLFRARMRLKEALLEFEEQLNE